MNNPVEKKEDREAVTFEGPVDSVYTGASGRVSLDVGTGAPVLILASSACGCDHILEIAGSFNRCFSIWIWKSALSRPSFTRTEMGLSEMEHAFIHSTWWHSFRGPGCGRRGGGDR